MLKVKDFFKKNKKFLWIFITNKHKILLGGYNMSKSYKPGEIAPESGNYVAYDSQGNNGGACYLEEGQRFPATQHSGSYYVKQD